MYMAMGHVLRGDDVHPFVVCEKDFGVFTWGTRELNPFPHWFSQKGRF